MARLWLLPLRPDPEAAAIAALLRQVGEETAITWPSQVTDGDEIIAIERDEDWPEWARGNDSVVPIDHHAPGDPGYGRPPADFLAASSLGQVIRHLAVAKNLPRDWPVFSGPAPDPDPQHEHGRMGVVDGRQVVLLGSYEAAEIPDDLMLCAAADHCLAAAYRGECPGVYPDALMRWRVESRAAHQGRTVEAVLAEIDRARRILRHAQRCRACAQVADPDQAGLSLDDAGVPGGTGPCGDQHRWISSMCSHVRYEAALCYCCGEPQGYCQRGNDPIGPPVETDRCNYVDLRGAHIPGLPEAACREGIPFLASLRERDGREKTVLQAAPSALVAEFLAGRVVPGLSGLYGDPARGFAGGYVPTA